MNEAFEECIPPLPHYYPSNYRYLGDKSWEELLGINEIKAFVDQLASMRLSLLHLFRLGVKLAGPILFLLGFSVGTRTVNTFLGYACPNLPLYHFISRYRLAQIISCFGPAVVQKTLPKDVGEALYHLAILINEGLWHISRALVTLVLRILIGAFNQPLHEVSKKFIAKTFRKGELSYGTSPDLSLLSWFSPVSTTRSAAQQVHMITFSHLGLSFEVRDVGKEQKAVANSEKTPGFYIEKKQHHPLLNTYFPSLLLTKQAQQKKIHLAALSSAELFSLFATKGIGGLTLSPFIEQTLHSLYANRRRIGKHPVYTYDVREKDQLKATDNEGRAYLFLFELAQGRTTKGYEVFKELSPDVFETEASGDALKTGLLFLALSQSSPESKKFFLEGIALKERLAIPPSQSAPWMDMLLEVTSRQAYSDYLQESTFPLSPEDIEALSQKFEGKGQKLGESIPEGLTAETLLSLIKEQIGELPPDLASMDLEALLQIITKLS